MPPPCKAGPIDDAEAWLIATDSATFADAASRFGVTRNSLRARIENRYSSLASARLLRDAGVLKPDAGRIIGAVRRCIRCGVSSKMDRNQRICGLCSAQIAKIHDGGV